jgi:hypothetical protein
MLPMPAVLAARQGRRALIVICWIIDLPRSLCHAYGGERAADRRPDAAHGPRCNEAERVGARAG